MLKVKCVVVVLVLILFTTSCSRMTPAGFWTDFHEDLITTNDSDQGPWGGYREIHWKRVHAKSFTPNEVIEFASEKGWELTDSLSYVNNSIKPLTNYLNNDYSFDILRESALKRIKSPYNYVFVFTTGWIAVEPGNARDTDKNGFVVINSEGTELTVYHLWGE